MKSNKVRKPNCT